MNLIQLLLEFNKISIEIANKKDNDDLANFLYEKLKKIVDFKGFTLGKIVGSSIVYNFYVEEGQIFKGLEKTIEKEKSLAYYAVSKNEILVINDFETEIDKYVKGTSKVGKQDIEYNSILVYPLQIENKVIGFFSIQDTSKNFFDDEKIILFKEVGKYLSLIFDRIENKNSNKEITKVKIENNQTSNPIKKFLNGVKEKAGNIDHLIEIFGITLKEQYGLKEFNFLIYKIFSNHSDYYYYDKYGKLGKREIKEQMVIKTSQMDVILEFDGLFMGNLYIDEIDFYRLDETFEILFDTFLLVLSCILEKEEAEYENKERTQLIEALENSYKNLKVLNEMIKGITSTMDIKELGRRVYKGLVSILNSDCSVLLAYMNKGKLEYDIVIDYGKEYEMSLVDIEDTNSFASWVIRNGQMVVINDLSKEAYKYLGDNYSNEKGKIGEVETNSLIYVPLYKDGDVVGVFTVQKKEKNFFDNYNIELIKGITSFVNIAIINLIEARQLSIEIEEKRNYERKLKKINTKLEKLSSMDSLTKLYNRRYFERILREFWSKAKESKGELGFLIFDLDYFKQINDNYGHKEGDRVLVDVSKILKKYVSPQVKFGRFGGDEFVGIIGNPDKDNLLELANNIMMEVGKIKVEIPFSPKGVLTLTIGTTIINPNVDKSMDELFIKADKALYIGKEKGRAQIVFL